METRDMALELHQKGFNCAQSVLCACEKSTGLDGKTASALAAGFGGGVRCGEICGAVSGAVMALGCAFPFTDGEDAAAKKKIAALTNALTGRFAERFGCLRCVELKRAGHSCAELIGFASELAEQIISENK